MKIKNINQKTYKLLKIYLLILGISLKEINNLNTSITVFINHKSEIIELHFKIALKIIQDYHLNKRKILFMSTQNINQTIFQKVIERTKHNFIETSNWTPGIFKRCFSFLQSPPNFQKIIQTSSLYLRKKKMAEKLINKPDLVVLLSPHIDPEILDEINQFSIPVISFYNSSKLDRFTTYKIVEKTKQVNFCSFLLYSILKKQNKK